LPKYRVDTDQGAYEIELDSEPGSPEELHSLVSEALTRPAAAWSHVSMAAPEPPAPTTQEPEGLLKGTLMATPRQATAGYQAMQSAGQPGLPFTQRLLRSAGGLAQVAAAVPPFAQAAHLGGEAAAALEPSLEVMPKIAAGIQATTGMPLAQGPIPQDIETARSLGAVAGASAVPVGSILRAARGLRGVLPGRAITEAATAAEAAAPVAEALPANIAKSMADDEAGFAAMGAKPIPTPVPAVPEVAPPAATGRTTVGPIAATRRLLNLDSPSDFARGNESTEKLVDAVQNRAATKHVLEEDLIRQAAKVYEPLGKDQNAIRRVNALLDTKSGEQVAKDVLTPAEMKVYTGAREWFNKLADSMGMEGDQRITDYFPRLREQLGVQEKRIVQVGKGEVPTYITDTTPNRLVRQNFEKPRTSAAPADDLGIEPILAYARGAANKIAFSGGTHPITGKVTGSVLDEIKDLLPGIPPDKAKYFADYVNDVIGIPRSKPGEVSQAMIELNKSLKAKTGADVAGWEFGRTISGNPVTPLQNLTQTILALGHMSPMNWAKGWGGVVKAYTNPAEWERLRQLGVTSAPSKADTAFRTQVGEGGFFSKLIEKGAGWFKSTENVNRIQTFNGAMEEAASRGLTGAKAEEFAKKVVRDVHFTFGPEDASELSRTVRNPLGRSVLQYKTFPAKFGIAVKQMAADDIRDLPKFFSKLGSGDIAGALSVAPTRIGKVAGATGALFGAGSVIPNADELFGLKPDSLASTGLVGAIGLSMGNALGLGVLPLDSFRNFMFWLPGPAIAHALDAASAGYTLASKGTPWEGTYNFDLQSAVQGKFGKTSNVIDPEVTASRIARSVPIAGVQLDRLRKGIIHYRSTAPNAQREPVTAAETVGLSPLGPGHRQIRSTPETTGPLSKLLGSQGVEAMRMSLGLRDQRTQAIQRLTQNLMADQTLDREDARMAAERMVAGDSAGARNIIQNRGMPPGAGSVMGAVKAAALPPEIRKGLRAPLPLRGKFLGTLPNLPGEE